MYHQCYSCSLKVFRVLLFVVCGNQVLEVGSLFILDEDTYDPYDVL